MVLARQQFSTTARVIAWFLAAICGSGGILGVVLAVVHRNVLLGVAGLGVLALAVLYAGAAKRGRPWGWRAIR